MVRKERSHCSFSKNSHKGSEEFLSYQLIGPLPWHKWLEILFQKELIHRLSLYMHYCGMYLDIHANYGKDC